MKLEHEITAKKEVHAVTSPISETVAESFADLRAKISVFKKFSASETLQVNVLPTIVNISECVMIYHNVPNYWNLVNVVRPSVQEHMHLGPLIGAPEHYSFRIMHADFRSGQV